MLAASVADCARPGQGEGEGAPIVVERPRAASAQGSGRSDDGTLTWSYTTGPGNARRTVVSLRKDGAMRQVLALDVPGKES
jgi:hypothetical protein